MIKLLVNLKVAQMLPKIITKRIGELLFKHDLYSCHGIICIHGMTNENGLSFFNEKRRVDFTI